MAKRQKILPRLILIIKALGLGFRQLYITLSTNLSARIHKLTYRAVSHPRNIVIIGASFAGYHAARCLANSLPTGYRVVIIEKNTHFQLTWVLPRFSVVPGHEEKAFIPYGGYLASVPGGSYEWVRDTAEGIIGNEDGTGRVELGSGGFVEYEYLVIATGAAGDLPSRVSVDSKKEGMEMLAREQGRLCSAADVVVVGGGAAGIELAGDAKGRYPEKNVTLVHSRERLLNGRFGERLSGKALEEMEALGVRVRLGERVEGEEGGFVRLKSGERIPCDYLVKCVGQRPNSGLVQALSLSSVSRSGHIKVRSTLQLADTRFDRVYAAGDVIDLEIIKNARSAFEQGQLVAWNIVRAIGQKKLHEYHYRWWEGTTALTLGLNKKVACMNDGSTELIIGLGGGKEELDSAMIWKYMGAKPYLDVD